jgi:hypothetical protein
MAVQPSQKKKKKKKKDIGLIAMYFCADFYSRLVE